MKKFILLTLIFSILFTMSGCFFVPILKSSEIVEGETVEKEILSTKETEPVTSEIEELDSTLEEIVVYEDDSFLLVAKEIDYSNDRYVKVKFYAENNSDKNIVLSGHYFSINGITMYCGFYVDVAAGKKTNDTLNINRSDLKEYGIAKIASIESHEFHISDSDTYKIISEFDFVLRTSVFDSYEKPISDYGQVVFDKDGITIKYCGIADNMIGESLKFYIQNNTEKDLIITAENVSVNGFTISGHMYTSSFSNCIIYDELTFLSSDMEENEITQIDEVTMTFEIFDSENFHTRWKTEEIVLTRKVNE